MPQGWSVHAADGLALSDSTHLVITPPQANAGAVPIGARVGLEFGVPAGTSIAAVHTATKSNADLGGCAGIYTVLTPTGNGAASRPTVVNESCSHEGYVFSLYASVPPGQPVPPPLFTAVAQGWRWTSLAPVGAQGFSLSALHMVSGNVGWALRRGTGPGGQPFSVWRTVDGGSSWHDVTPTGSSGQMLGGDTFLDAQRAWLATAPPPPAKPKVDGATRVMVWRTTDGGTTWQSTALTVPLPWAAGFPVSLSFANAKVGWLLAHPEYTMNSMPGELFATDDGGASWKLISRADMGRNGATTHATPGLPVGGRVTLQSRSSGWLVASYTSTTPRFLFHSTDGATTWTRVTLPVPAALSGDTIGVSAPPRFFAGSQFGFLPAVIWGSRGLESTAYVTRDGGSRWQPVRVPDASSGAVVTFLGDGHGWCWESTPDPSGSASLLTGALYATSDGGASWRALPADPYIGGMNKLGGNIVAMDFTSDEDGWALLKLPGATNPGLLRTSDGGLRWLPVGAVS